MAEPPATVIWVNAARNTGGSLGVSLIAKLLSHRKQFDRSLRVDLSGLAKGGGMTAAFSVERSNRRGHCRVRPPADVTRAGGHECRHPRFPRYAAG
jgi:hypothetical protein